jgi:hypothetical protein
LYCIISIQVQILTNATVVDEAIRFVYGKYKEKQKSPPSNSNENGKEESKEPVMTGIKIN